MQEYTEVKVKIGLCFEREDDVGRKNGNGNLQKKKPLVKFQEQISSPEEIGTYQLQGC